VTWLALVSFDVTTGSALDTYAVEAYEDVPHVHTGSHD
jgi:hypothetical protein